MKTLWKINRDQRYELESSKSAWICIYVLPSKLHYFFMSFFFLRLQFTSRSCDKWLWCLRQGLRCASFFTELVVLSTALAAEKSSCNCCSLSQSIPLSPIRAGLRRMKELPNTYCLESLVPRKTDQGNLLHLCSCRFAVHGGSLFCKRLLTVGLSAPGLVSKHTHMGNEETWVNTESPLAATTTFQDFHATGYPRQQSPAAFGDGFWVLLQKTSIFSSLGISEALLVYRESLVWEGLEKCL